MVALAMEAKAAAYRQEHNANIRLAWNIAALSRTRKLPNVETLFARERRPAQTWQEQQTLMQQWFDVQQRRKAAEGAGHG